MKEGDRVKILKHTIPSLIGKIATIDEIQLFEGDLEYWVKIENSGPVQLLHEGEFEVIE